MESTTESGWTAQMRDHLDALVRHEPAASDAERIDRLRVLEQAKAIVAAEQVRLTVELTASQQQAQREAGEPERRIGLGIGSQVGLAKRESPAKGRAFVHFSQVLVFEMPNTFAVLAAGRTTEKRARAVVTRTETLTTDQRQLIDEEIAGLLEGWSDTDVEAEITKRVHRMDPRGATERAEKAALDRRVTLRTAPDSMSFLTGHLPAAYGVAAHAALTREADRARAAGDLRSRGQIMADLFFERLTGQSAAEAPPMAINLVMTDQSLLSFGDHDDEPAQLEGYGPVPAEIVRRLALAADAEGDVWVQRLFSDPDTQQLAAIDSQARFFRGALRRLIVARDQRCRTPWCGAPIRQVDHVVDDADGGPTSGINGEGLCEACNYAKTALGWRAFTVGSGTHTVWLTTPTGHRYRSRPPDPPRVTDEPPLTPEDLEFRRALDQCLQKLEDELRSA